MSPLAARSKRDAPFLGRKPGRQWCRPSIPFTAIAFAAGESSTFASGFRYARARTNAHEFWERFADDGDLVGLKLVLLAGMILLTALLERGV